MIQKLLPLFIISLFIISCSGGKKNGQNIQHTPPVVTSDGLSISFPDSVTSSFFTTESLSEKEMETELKVVGTLAASILPSSSGGTRNVVLLDNPELSASYAHYSQSLNQINQLQNVSIKQKELELNRMKELHAHGSATGQELLTAETELAMAKAELEGERAELMEHETVLRSQGLNPTMLQSAKVGSAYFICSIPESQIGWVEEGGECVLTFAAYPDDKFVGKIDGMADVVDGSTRMLKVRVLLDNSSGKLKVGMFAHTLFKLKGVGMKSINAHALITIKGKHYLFVKKSEKEFERREVTIGSQIGDRVIVTSGLESSDQVVVKGVMQLKGLSFGY